MAEEEHILEKRKEKVRAFFKQKQEWLYYIVLAFIVWFGAIFVRTANIDRLKDVTGGLTLAPDLDPYLFLRHAQHIVEAGSLSGIDPFRYVPIGLEYASELPFVAYGIAYLYKFLSIFSSEVTVTYAAIVFPVVFFVGTLIAFFLLVRRMFRENELSNVIALISTAALAVIPGFVHRTVAGVPEKESAAFLFMFLALYWIVCAWQSESWKKAGLFGLLAGLSTGLMGLTWGGVTFLFVVVSLSSFVYFFTDKFRRKDLLAYGLWILGFTILLFPHARYGLGIFTSTTTGFAYFTLGLMISHLVLFKTNLKEKLKLDKVKIPSKIASLIILGVLALLMILVISPGIFQGVVQDLTNTLIRPFEAQRFTVTVAEHNRPFLESWKGSLGTLFWVFFLGSMLLMYEALKKLKSKDRQVLLTTFILMAFGIIFTRLKPDSVLDGSSTFSMFLFIGSIILFAASILYVYFKREEFEINPAYIIGLVWVFFGLISARGAIRLLYFVYPIATWVVGYTVVVLSQKAWENKEDVMRIVLGVLAVSTIIMTGWGIYNFSVRAYNEVNYGSIPSTYNVQWQLAMDWVRDNTPEDAVFAHWWDYGYWVQTIGQRATILDGGNAIVYWNHLMGRHVLTGENEEEALEFLKTHDATHLLIDSTDIGKYPAYSSIGSDEDYDRYSFVPMFSFNEQLTQERRNETLYVLSGGVTLDEDIIWKDQIFLEGATGIGGFVLPIKRINESAQGTLGQPEAMVVHNGQQLNVPIKCVYLDGKITFEEEGMEGCLYLMPSVTNQGMQRIGGGYWLSPRLMRSLMTKLYLFDEGENIKLVHVEDHPAIKELNNNYNLNLPSLAIVNGAFVGPIKIWEVNYPKDIQKNPDYLELDYPEDRPGLWQVRR